MNYMSYSKIQRKDKPPGNPSLLTRKNYDDTPITNNILKYAETVMLVALVVGLSTCNYIPALSENYIVTLFFQIYTWLFVICEILFKAYRLFLNVTEKNEPVMSQSNLSNMILFVASALLALSGLVPINEKVGLNVSTLISAVALCIFPFNLADLLMYENMTKRDTIFNACYALITCSGLVSFYLGYNLLGLASVIVLITKGVQISLEKEPSVEQKNTKKQLLEYFLPLGFALITAAIIVYCCVNRIELKLPNLSCFGCGSSVSSDQSATIIE